MLTGESMNDVNRAPPCWKCPDDPKFKDVYREGLGSGLGCKC